jgi:hypothetical protein
MIVTTTKLVTESIVYDGAEQTEVGPRNLTLHRPAGVGTKNDVFRGFWMLSGQTYRVAYDGTGFRVTTPDWPADHAIYLVDAADGLFRVYELESVDGGTFDLDEHGTYELSEVDRAWTVRTI